MNDPTGPNSMDPQETNGGTASGPGPSGQPSPEPQPPTRRSAWFYASTLAGGFVLLLMLLIAGLLIYASTASFSNIVRKRLIAALEDSTGGRVELQSFRWSIFHLGFEARNLTIHGLESPKDVPYAHADRLYVKVEILSFFRPKVDLRYVEADHPVFHLIVYPDGHTNQPRPKTRVPSDSSLSDTIFDLKIRRLEIERGLALINEHPYALNLRAKDVGAVVTYSEPKDHYLAELRIADLDLQHGSAPVLASRLFLQAEVARNALQVRALHFSSGGSRLDASGSVEDFAHPRWRLASRGKIDLREIGALAGVAGLRQGVADLDLKAQGAADGRFSVDGSVRLVNGAYRDEYAVLAGVDAAGRLNITPEAIVLDRLTARLRQGGSINGSLRISRWLTEPNPVARQSSKPAGKARKVPSPQSPVFQIRAQIHRVRLPTVLRVVAVRRYQDLGFDTAADGAVNVDWSGDADDFTLGADLRLSAPRVAAPGDLPVSGLVNAKYFQRAGAVQINRLEAQTPGTNAKINGLLAVYPISRPSALQIGAVTTNLGEFDRVLRDLGLQLNGRAGVAAIPVQLHGQAGFEGRLSGSLIAPDVQGELTATNFSTDLDFEDFAAQSSSAEQSSPEVRSVSLPAARSAANRGANRRMIHWDRMDAVGEYSPEAISIEHATLAGGAAKITLQGKLAAHEISRRRNAYDQFSAIQAAAAIHGASVTDLMAIAGRPIPLTGEVNLQVHVGGTLEDLNGGGQLQLQGGAIAGEPYKSIVANLNFTGHEINLVHLTLLQDGGTAVANGNYDFKTNRFLANLDATNFEISHFQHLRNSGYPINGNLKFDAHASGTLDHPSVLAGIHVTKLTFQGQPFGGIDAVVHTQGDVAYFTAHSIWLAARLDLTGQTVLRERYATQAKLVFSGLDIDPILKTLNVQAVTGHSLIGGSIALSGPAADPEEFSGNAEISRFSVTLQNITLNSEGPLRASYGDGLIRITQAHIVGPSTDVFLSGTADLMRERDLDLSANGSVNMKLAQTFDPDINASGMVRFNVDAYGTITKPSMTGQVQLTNVAMALNDVPTGISNLNGTLVFDQDRLEVKNLVGTTGGGQLKLAGFITYQNGIYGDLTATGRDIRIRYSGISATADTTLHLQGSEANMLLSGNVQITRFIIGPNLDFAVFANTTAASAPPNPNAPSSHLRLDVRITSAPQLDFQNSYAQLAGSVDLRIRGTLAQPAVLGRINITEGTANFAGTTYQLQHGEINFTNPVRIEPIIDIDATTRIEEYDVTVGLHGSTAHLTPIFRSEPPLPQADVISLLALGRTSEEQQVYSQEEENTGINQTSNALLGGALNATVSSRVQKLFGVGSVKIDPTYLGNLGDSTARITVQQNISRNVQLTYATNVNTTAEQLLQAQINLTTNISILAIRDESDVFSMVLKVRKRLR